MVIFRGPSEIRIERSESRARVTGWVLFVGLAGLAVSGAFVSKLDSAADWLSVGSLFLLGLLFLRLNLGSRMVVVIRPDKIGHGHMGRDMWWVDRSGITSVSITAVDEFAVHLGRSDGRPGETLFLNDSFDRAELEDAFEEAGITVR